MIQDPIPTKMTSTSMMIDSASTSLNQKITTTSPTKSSMHMVTVPSTSQTTVLTTNMPRHTELIKDTRSLSLTTSQDRSHTTFSPVFEGNDVN